MRLDPLVALWTQRIGASWPPTLNYYERRLDVLRRFEDEGLLRQFSVSEDDVSARLGDANHSINFSPTGLVAGLYQPDGDEERVRYAMAVVVEVLEPDEIVVPTFDFQWVVELEEAYDDARRRAARVAAPSSLAQANDFALWADGHLEEPDANYFFECGVVDASELPTRLARLHGRAGAADPRSPPSLWPRDVLPEVAFFCGVNWAVDVADESLERVFELWDATRDVSQGLVFDLMSHFDLAGNE
jgi:hypothetical protein